MLTGQITGHGEEAGSLSWDRRRDLHEVKILAVWCTKLVISRSIVAPASRGTGVHVLEPDTVADRLACMATGGVVHDLLPFIASDGLQ